LVGSGTCEKKRREEDKKDYKIIVRYSGKSMGEMMRWSSVYSRLGLDLA